MQKIHGVLKVAVAASLLSGVVLCGGCARDGILPVEEPMVSDAVGPDYVSVESALAALARFQADDPTTRSSDVPAVSHVDVLMRSEVSPATRTSGTAADAPLCYIAQFEGGGYAVLGADAKQGGVIAYVPQGRLTAADMAAAKAATDRGEDYETPTYIHACMVAYLEAAADGKVEREANDDAATRIDIVGGFPMEPFDPRLLKTEWHQWYPYNDSCPFINGERAPVGCVALALGQILAYNKQMFDVGPEVIYRPGIQENSYRPAWSIITKAIQTPTPPANCYYELGRYLHNIGNAVSITYGYPQTNAEDIYKVINFIKEVVGYKNVSLRTARFADIKKMIQNHNPVYARGIANIDDEKHHIEKTGGHAWVIDYYDTKEEIFTTPDGYVKFDYNYVHCRYGYGGDYDGWYLLEPRSTVESYNLQQIIYYTL